MVKEISDLLFQRVTKYEHTLHYNTPNTSIKGVCQCLAAGTRHNSFYQKCDLSNINFLIDTGACKSFLPIIYESESLSKYQGSPITTANGEKLNIKGCQELKLKFKENVYTWKFIVADVSFPILGADFLCYHNLAVDVRGQSLIPLQTHIAPAQTTSPEIPDAISKVLLKYQDVFSSDLSQRKNMTKSHSAVHHITTKGPPLHAKFRRLCPDKLKIAKEVFADLERQGICQKAASPWSSPLHMVGYLNRMEVFVPAEIIVASTT